MKNLLKDFVIGLAMIVAFAAMNHYYPQHPVMAFGIATGFLMGFKSEWI